MPTSNLNLSSTSEAAGSAISFLTWRTHMDGETAESNMGKIDAWAGEVSGSFVAINSVFADGWISFNGYDIDVSASSISLPTGLASILAIGDKMKIMQSESSGGGEPYTTRYYYVVNIQGDSAILAGSPNFPLTVHDIHSTHYSKLSTPTGFPQWFTWTPTWTGFFVDMEAEPEPILSYPASSGRFCINQRTVFLNIQCSASGLSDANTMTITGMPIWAQAGFTYTALTNKAMDNTLPLTAPGLAIVTGNGVTFTTDYLLTSASGWTSSGGKYANFDISFPF